MTLIFNGFNRPYLVAAMHMVARHLGAKLCYSIDIQPPAPQLDGVEYRHISILDAIRARYPDEELQACRPVDEPLLGSLTDVETMTLKMMDRIGDGKGWPDHAARRMMYVRHVRYWLDFLERHDVRLLALTNFPHEMHDYVLYELCRRRGIKVLNFGFSPLSEASFLFVDDWRSGPYGLKARFEAQRGAKEPPALTGVYAEHWRAMTDAKPEMPFYIPAYKKQLARDRRLLTAVADFSKALAVKAKRRTGVTKLRKMLDPGIWTRNAKRFAAQRSMVRQDAELMRYYDARAVAADLEQDFVFVALHYQPEMSTTPLGGAFAYQELMVAMLAAALPRSWRLYVKEHPVQRARGRSKEFYDALLANPQVSLVSRDLPSTVLVKHCRAVATVTGTVGWEGVFMGKPVLVFGSVSYQLLSGVFSVKSNQDCIRAFAAIADGVKPSPGEAREFLKAVEDVAVVGYFDGFYAKVAAHSPEENARRLGAAMVAAL